MDGRNSHVRFLGIPFFVLRVDDVVGVRHRFAGELRRLDASVKSPFAPLILGHGWCRRTGRQLVFAPFFGFLAVASD